ncbi:MAG: metallophosphoesterase [Acidimicrobiaceae bacterium]|nr:metallophosphoesterase [Acidimicrobiaceae bacterium]MCY3607211.1 metallophosphoesterase [Acidimicrobiaceae bacterium]MDE0676227.1 metallophosphoesterase [Acidimicrobiaceae bacterium]
MRFLAFSDLHLDAPFAQGGRDLADLRRAELRRTLRRITGLAAELDVDALLCAGDLYEHDRFTPDTVTLLEREFEAIAPIPVLISPGNHDWYGPRSLYRAAGWGENVHVFTSGEWTAWNGLDGFRIWGFAHQAPSGTPNPFEGFQAIGEAVHLGLFHGSEDSGWSWASQRDDRKLPHAPFSVEHISTAGLTHAVVGHYHQRVEGAVHTYGGAPAPLSFGEAGDGGAVELEFDDAGELVERKWHTVFELEVHGNLELDVSGCGSIGEIEDKLAELLAPLSGIGRVTLVGELSPTANCNIERLAARKGSLEHLSVRMGELRAGYDLDQIRGESSVKGEFVRAVEADREMGPELKQRVIVTGLRALDGYGDLEVV